MYGGWLFDPERRDGDLYMAEEVNGWYVMVFHNRTEADYPSVSVMGAHFPLDGTLESTDEQLEASCLEAEAFLKSWQEAGAGEEAFRELALARSHTDGFAYENRSLTKGVLPDNPQKWAFDPQRKAGDCEVLYSPEGFYVLYWIGTSVPAWQVLAQEDMKEEAFAAWFDTLMEQSVLVRHEDVLSHAGGYE